MEDCTDLHIGACSIPIGRPAHHWSVMLGDTNATRRTNFQIRLLTGCDGLEQDASHFRYRTQGRSSGSTLYHRISISTQGCQNSHITISTIGFYCCPSGLLSGIGGNKEEEEEDRSKTEEQKTGEAWERG